MQRHYHVLVGSEGSYMPDSNNVYGSRRDAESAAAWEARNIMEDGYSSDDKADWYHKSGSAKSGLIVIDTGRSLDAIIQVVECSEKDCEESMEGARQWIG